MTEAATTSFGAMDDDDGFTSIEIDYSNDYPASKRDKYYESMCGLTFILFFSAFLVAIYVFVQVPALHKSDVMWSSVVCAILALTAWVSSSSCSCDYRHSVLNRA